MSSDGQDQPVAPYSVADLRRRAPLHFLAKAENARFAARALGALSEERLASLAVEVGYGGTASIAIHESLVREVSLSLELIVKAVIAQKLEGDAALAHVKSVRPTHDLLGLWRDAGLTPLKGHKLRTLVQAKHFLEWAGRYAAPLTDAAYARFHDDIEAAEQDIASTTIGGLRVRFSDPLTWERGEEVYSIARKAFDAARSDARPFDH